MRRVLISNEDINQLKNNNIFTDGITNDTAVIVYKHKELNDRDLEIYIKGCFYGNNEANVIHILNNTFLTFDDYLLLFVNAIAGNNYRVLKYIIDVMKTVSFSYKWLEFNQANNINNLPSFDKLIEKINKYVIKKTHKDYTEEIKQYLIEYPYGVINDTINTSKPLKSLINKSLNSLLDKNIQLINHLRCEFINCSINGVIKKLLESNYYFDDTIMELLNIVDNIDINTVDILFKNNMNVAKYISKLNTRATRDDIETFVSICSKIDYDLFTYIISIIELDAVWLFDIDEFINFLEECYKNDDKRVMQFAVVLKGVNCFECMTDLFKFVILHGDKKLFEYIHNIHYAVMDLDDCPDLVLYNCCKYNKIDFIKFLLQKYPIYCNQGALNNCIRSIIEDDNVNIFKLFELHNRIEIERWFNELCNHHNCFVQITDYIIPLVYKLPNGQRLFNSGYLVACQTGSAYCIKKLFLHASSGFIVEGFSHMCKTEYLNRNRKKALLEYMNFNNAGRWSPLHLCLNCGLPIHVHYNHQ